MKCFYRKSAFHTAFSPAIRNKNMLIMPNIQLSKYFLKVMTVSYLHSSNFNKLTLLYLKNRSWKKMCWVSKPYQFVFRLELQNGRVSLQITYITVFSRRFEVTWWLCWLCGYFLNAGGRFVVFVTESISLCNLIVLFHWP